MVGRGVGCWALAVLPLLLTGVEAHAEAQGVAARVAFVKGTATRSLPSGGPAQPLRRAEYVREGETVATEDGALLQLTLADGSLLRLGPRSRLKVRPAAPSATGPVPQAELGAGMLWARITKAVGGETRFKLHTQNAVTGVRGTVFTVSLGPDGGAVVAVYEGLVSVGGPEGGTAIWERAVAANMGIVVGPDGAPAEPQPLSALLQGARAAGDVQWTAWNQEMDAAPAPEGEPAGESGPGAKKEDPALRLRDDLSTRSPEQMLADNERAMAEMRDALKVTLDLLSKARLKKDIVLLNCVNERLTQIKGVLKVAEEASTALQEHAAAGQDSEARVAYSKIVLAKERIATLRVQAQNCVGAEGYYGGETEVVTDIDPELAGGDPFFGDRGTLDNPRDDNADRKDTADNTSEETPPPPPPSSVFQ
ncbi:MAG: FecR family protein [Myxococcota bacterium]